MFSVVFFFLLFQCLNFSSTVCVIIAPTNNCTNRTKHRLTFILPQKMLYFCQVIAIMNMVACSGFLLFSISKFPPPQVPHFHQLLQLCCLRDTCSGLYHQLLLLYWYRRKPVAEFTCIRTNLERLQSLLGSSWGRGAREEQATARRLLNGWLRPRLPSPPAEHSSALSLSWLSSALSGSAPQATACEQLHCFWTGILIIFFKSIYLYCLGSE